MTVLQPCATCWFRDKDCALKARVGKSVRGLGLTVARFTCKIQADEYRPGRRVLATIRSAVTGGGRWGDSLDDAEVRATVISRSSKPGKFLIWPDDDEHETLDHVQNERKLCALRSFLLKPLDEPDRPERIAELQALDGKALADEFGGGF